MSLQNLTEDALYGLLPEGIISLDQQGLIQAVVGGYQDRIDDLRSYTSKLELLVTGAGLPEVDPKGVPQPNAIICQIQSPQGKIYSRSLDIKDDSPPSDSTELVTWAATQLQLDEYHVLLSAAYGVDKLRLVDANVLAGLASTVGAVLYQTAAMEPLNAYSDARRLLQTWFPRLQFKGTAESFEALGKLLGFDDVRMTPLFGRLSPRIANNVGDPQNDQDFAAVPDYWPKQMRDVFYDPLILNDGPFFTWTGTATARFGTNDTSFYTEVVNGFNPFVAVKIISSGPTDPDAALSPFILVGGGPETKASVSPAGSGLLFEAISTGSSFNGLEIHALSIDNGTHTVLSITDRLSAIKYRTSYYDLALTMDFDRALNQFGTNVASANKDLVENPLAASFNGTAQSPYRPWSAGSITQQSTQVDWLNEINPTGTRTIVSGRTQATLATRELSQTDLSAAGAQVVQAMEEVRPATRLPLHVNVGYLIRDQVAYAPYCGSAGTIITTGTSGTYFGTLTGYPEVPYTAQFTANGVTLIEEAIIANPNVVNLRSPDLTVGGTFNYNDNSYLVTFTGVSAGTHVVAAYAPSSTEVVRTDPEVGCTSIGYQTRPEDELDTAMVDMADEYPWRRSLVLGGELVDFNTYNPPTPDISVEYVGQTAAVFSQTGAQYDVQVIVPGDYPPRFVVQERSTSAYVPGQRAIAFTGTFRDLAATRPSSGTLLGGLDSVMQSGWQLYHFGLVSGVLVADAPKFYGDHHRTGLALWYPFNEQASDGLEVADHSPYAGNAFVKGLSPGDRKFDPARGNFLTANQGLSLTSPIARGFVNEKFAGGFWLRALNEYPNEQTIVQAGPLFITLAGTMGGQHANFYLQAPDGSRPGVATTTLKLQWNYISWSYDGVETLTLNTWDSNGTLVNQLLHADNIDFNLDSFVEVKCPGISYDIQDLRLWNISKNTAQLNLAHYHQPQATACLYAPAFLESVNTYDHYAVRVLPSGFVVPEQMPTSTITDKLAWVQRYDYMANYLAQSRFAETGLGSGNTLPRTQRLGTQWDSLTAAGTVVVSNWIGNYIGMNAAWIADNPKGTRLVLTESGSIATGIPGSLVSTGTNSPWPNPLQATNPCRDRIWVKGDDGFVWQVGLAKTLGSASFTTEKLFTQTGSEQPTGAQVLLSDGGVGKKLAVNTSGTVYSGTYTGTLTTAPVYLYATEDTYVSLAGANLFSTWVDVNTFGLDQSPAVAAIQENGKISFQISTGLDSGYYRLEVTSGNIGKVDSAFVGFDVVITVGDLSFQAVLCPGQTGADFTQTDTFEFTLPNALPGSPSSWLLTFDWNNALSDSSKGTARQLAISSIRLVRHRTTLYRVNVFSGSVAMTAMGTLPANFGTTPGGWLASMTSWGTSYTYVHESQAYTANDTVSNPQPLSNLLTATTALRAESIILAGSFTLPDPAIPGIATYSGVGFDYGDIYDTMESYADGVVVSALNGGQGWSAAYVDRASYTGLQEWDSMETYISGEAVNGLNGGTGFVGSYVDKSGYASAIGSDNMESYTVGAAVNGLNGGSGFTAAYVDR